MKRFALVLTGIFLAFSSHAIIPDRKYIRLPQQEGLIYKELGVVADDGYGIETWFYPAQDMPGEGAGQDETEAPYVADMERWFVETVSFLSDNSGE